jgi:hypothetical protein
MSAVAQITRYETDEAQAPAVLDAIAQSEEQVSELYNYCDMLHRAQVEHDAHSCVVCFEQR